ncbi:hypothetical protein [Dactylosporangium sp. CS-033363]|uniref:hypothetical protein n=1 Tax=Dactylosporangium sp. CS-033363 TaxID=3239935 RepID=UPI003D8DD268
MSTDERATQPVDLSALATHETEPLHAADAAAGDGDGTDFGAIDAHIDDELSDDEDDASFDLGTDVAHPTLDHNGGPAFDLDRDISL